MILLVFRTSSLKLGGYMKKMLFVFVNFFFILSCANTPRDKECRYFPNEDEYKVYHADDKLWRHILLPSTELGMTIRTFPIDLTKKPVQTPSKKEHPLRLDEIEKEDLDDVRVVYWQKVENGCYCVERENDTGFRPWTVWTPEVFNAVQNRKSGLTGPPLPSFPQEPLNIFANTTLPKTVTKNSADKLGKCVSDVLKGNFKGKNFWIANVGIKDSNLGQYIIEQLKKRGAKHEYENADFVVNAWLDMSNETILKEENGIKNFYREAKLDIYFNCMNDNHPKISDNLKKEPVVFVNTEIRIYIDALVAQIEDKNVSEWHIAVEKLKPLIAQAIP